VTERQNEVKSQKALTVKPDLKREKEKTRNKKGHRF
jgi:hypothetical protein